MLALKIPLRIVIHYLSEKNIFEKHGDLFISFPNKEKLITFEIDRYYLEFIKKHYQNFYLMTPDIQLTQNSHPFLKVYDNIFDVMNQHHNCDVIKIPLKRKNDHNKEYLIKEGTTNTRKGFVKEFTNSYLSGIIKGNQDLLLLIDK